MTLDTTTREGQPLNYRTIMRGSRKFFSDMVQLWGVFLVDEEIQIPIKVCHHWSASVTPFKWRFAGEPMMARHWMLAWYVNFRWIRTSLLRNPIFFVIFQGSGSAVSPPPPDSHLTMHWPRILSGWGEGYWQPCFKSSTYFTEGRIASLGGPHWEETQNRATDWMKICYKWYVHYFNLKIAHTKRYKARYL